MTWTQPVPNTSRIGSTALWVAQYWRKGGKVGEECHVLCANNIGIECGSMLTVLKHGSLHLDGRGNLAVMGLVPPSVDPNTLETGLLYQAKRPITEADEAAWRLTGKLP